MTACPTWCVLGPRCNGEHWSSPGEGLWSTIRATGDPEYDGPLDVTPHPVWDEMDGLQPVVGVWLCGGRRGADDFTFHLRPAEAERVAEQLVRAARAVAP